MKYIIILLMFSTSALAGGSHHRDTVTNVTVTNVNQTVSDQALSIAAGQHHYKATSSLQWSIGVGHDEKSAISFGLGKQVGKVFISGNLSSDSTSSVIGIGFSGTF